MNYKNKCMLLAFALAFGLALFGPGTPARAAEGPYFIHGDEVNLRTAPDGEIVDQLALNEKVFVIARDGDWCHISAPGRELKGWVFSGYVSEGRKAVEAKPGDSAQQSGDISDPPVEPAVEQPIKSPANVIEVCLEDSEPLTVASYAGDGSFIPDDPSGTEAGSLRQAGLEPDKLLTPEKAIEQSKSGTKSGSSTATEIKSPGSIVPVTSPVLLENNFYKPVGGHDLALIKGTNVNVRKDASLKSEVLTKVDDGDKLYVVSYEDPWYYVSIPGKDIKGWVFGEFVDELARVEVTGTQVRLRESPNTESRIKDELSTGEVFFEFERKNGWVLVASSASGVKGWIKQEYLTKTERSASRPYTVNGDDVNFRASPAVDADILNQLARGTEVEVHGRSEKWSFIVAGGQKGWMYSEYLSPVGRGTVVPQSELGQRLIARAKEMEGTPYVWGGESESGVDCSGLIFKLLCDEGCDAGCLPRRASEQMAQLGDAVEKESLEAGDLVFFTTYKAGPSHVGIYIGDGKFIHASSARSQVTINSLSEGYYKERFVGARRIGEAELKKLQ